MSEEERGEMIEMPSDLDRPWEPWTFKVGDRVRVRLSGECRRICDPGSWGADHHLIGHAPELDGRLGEITHVWTDPLSVEQGHQWGVLLDKPYVIAGEEWLADIFAAVELELLEANRA